MFSESDLRDLIEFRSDRSPVLSLYLNVDPTQQSTDQYRLTLRSMLKGVAGQADAADMEAIERYFDFEYAWQGKGVAVFSCRDSGFWRTFSLAVPVDNHAYVSHRPYIKPLTDVLDAYGRYGVILVDQEGARMFLFHLGELLEATGTLGEEVRRVKHGGASGVAGMRGGRPPRAARSAEEIVHRNLREVAELAETFCSSNGCSRLVLAGSEANVHRFYDLLPKALQDKVIGSFTADVGSSVADVQAHSLELIERVAEKRETELVDDLVSGWKRGAGATAGLSDTLEALQEHRPWILLVAAGYEASGFRCQNCRYLMLTEREECPLCGGKVDHVEDLVDTMVLRALEQGVEVEVVRANEKLADAGSIGALLRY